MGLASRAFSYVLSSWRRNRLEQRAKLEEGVIYRNRCSIMAAWYYIGKALSALGTALMERWLERNLAWMWRSIGAVSLIQSEVEAVSARPVLFPVPTKGKTRYYIWTCLIWYWNQASFGFYFVTESAVWIFIVSRSLFHSRTRFHDAPCQKEL